MDVYWILIWNYLAKLQNESSTRACDASVFQWIHSSDSIVWILDMSRLCIPLSVFVLAIIYYAAWTWHLCSNAQVGSCKSQIVSLWCFWAFPYAEMCGGCKGFALWLGSLYYIPHRILNIPEGCDHCWSISSPRWQGAIPRKREHMWQACTSGLSWR